MREDPEAMTKFNEHTHQPDLGFQIHFFNKMNQKSLEKWLISGMRQRGEEGMGQEEPARSCNDRKEANAQNLMACQKNK